MSRTSRRTPAARRASFAVAVLVATASAAATAQLRLPPVAAPPSGVLREVTTPVGSVAPTVSGDLTALRHLHIEELLRTQRRTLDVDPRGEPIVRGEILLLAPGPGRLERTAAAGFAVLRREPLAGLNTELVVLAVPSRTSIHRALHELRKADPEGTYDYNHLYFGGGKAGAGSARDPDGPGQPAAAGAAAIRVGLIDSGVDGDHPALATASVRSWGCGGTPHPESHGTAVGSLIAGTDTHFRGATPGATLYAADVYCGRADGGATDTIVAALGWLAAERVPAINISLVGPPNGTLAAVIARVLARGINVVAAVGNDGPAAAPLYPAAYPGVVGVTGVDARRRVLVEANRGPQVAFAAPGSDVVAAVAGGGYREVRGTSFAAPIVAAILATRCPEPARSCADEAVAALAREAIDLGRPGRDPVYGYGLVGDDIRNPAGK